MGGGGDRTDEEARVQCILEIVQELVKACREGKTVSLNKAMQFSPPSFLLMFALASSLKDDVKTYLKRGRKKTLKGDYEMSCACQWIDSKYFFSVEKIKCQKPGI